MAACDVVERPVDVAAVKYLEDTRRLLSMTVLSQKVVGNHASSIWSRGVLVCATMPVSEIGIEKDSRTSAFIQHRGRIMNANER